MKKILVTTVIILVTANVNAQTGMPQELTCTERVFNFSFSIGTKWRFSAPKMGPVEVARDAPDYIPAWSLKHTNVTPETHLLPLVEKLLNVEALSYPIDQQNYAPLFYYNSFSLIDKPKYLLPGINLSPSTTYKVLRPNFLVNSISYSP
jgi:hypothetical protein